MVTSTASEWTASKCSRTVTWLWAKSAPWLPTSLRNRASRTVVSFGGCSLFGYMQGLLNNQTFVRWLGLTLFMLVKRLEVDRLLNHKCLIGYYEVNVLKRVINLYIAVINPCERVVRHLYSLQILFSKNGKKNATQKNYKQLLFQVNFIVN